MSPIVQKIPMSPFILISSITIIVQIQFLRLIPSNIHFSFQILFIPLDVVFYINISMKEKVRISALFVSVYYDRIIVD